MFQFRRFPWYTYLFSIPCYIFNVTDCSIRTSADQYLLAIPRSFSQLTASFFGSQCQGILPALLLAWPFDLISQIIGSELCLSLYEKFFLVVFLPRFFICVRYYTFSSLHYFCFIQFSRCFWRPFRRLGGHKWTRTTDLTLIRRAL